MAGDKIKELIEIKGITVYKLAKDTGINKQTISNYIEGKNLPSSEKAIIIADYFNVNVDWLLTGNGERTKVHYEMPESPKRVLKEDPIPYNRANKNHKTQLETETQNLIFSIGRLSDSLQKISEANLLQAQVSERNSKNLEKLIEMFEKKYKN